MTAAEIRISQDNDGVWTVYASGLVVTDLTREEAEAFVEAHRRLRAMAKPALEATAHGSTGSTPQAHRQ